MWKILKHELKKIKGTFFMYFLLQIMSTALAICIPYLNGIFLDIITTSGKLVILYKFIITFSLISLFSIIFSYVVRVIKIKMKTRISYSINYKLVKHLEKINYLTFKKFDPVYINQRIYTDCNSVSDFFVENSILFFLNMIQLLLLFYIMVRINLNILLVIFIFLMFYIVSYILFKNKIYHSNFEYKESQNTFFSLLNKMVCMNKEIRSHSLYNKCGEKIKDGFDKYFIDTMKYGKLTSCFSSCEGIISLFFQIVILTIGGTLIIKKEISLGEYSVIYVYFNMIINCIRYYFNIGKNYKEAEASINRISSLFDIKAEDNGVEMIEKINSIKICNLTYNYMDNIKVIDGFSFQFVKNNFYVIIGKNGVGKSTLLDCIIYLLHNFDSGNIFINDKNIVKLNMYEIRKKFISISLQNEITLNVDVKEYLFDHLPRSKDEIRYIIESLHMKKFLINKNFDIVNLMDRKMDRLSSGEKQKIFIFKCFLQKADVFILDEPTSNLDLESKQLFLELMSFCKENKIVILITHDNEVMLKADSIINIENI